MHRILTRSIPAAAALLMFLVFTGRTPAQARFWISQGGAVGETMVLEAEAHATCGGWFYDVAISFDVHGGLVSFPLCRGRLDDAARMRHAIQVPPVPHLAGVGSRLVFWAVQSKSPPTPNGVSGVYHFTIGVPSGNRFVHSGAMPASFTDRQSHSWIVTNGGKLFYAGGLRIPRSRPPYPPGYIGPGPCTLPTYLPHFADFSWQNALLYDDATEAFLFDFRSGVSLPLGSMNRPRCDPALLSLSDGSVLIYGGDRGRARSLTVERFDPGTLQFQLLGNIPAFVNRWAPLTPITDPRTGDDHILIAGGQKSNVNIPDACLFDVKNRVYTTLTGMCFPRWRASSLALPGGRVFISGGSTLTPEPPYYCERTMDEAEIFDFQTRQFYPAGKMTRARFGHTLAPLSPTQILVLGGKTRSNQSPSIETYYDDMEVFDGVTLRFTPLPFRLHACRADLDVNPLPSGSFLITGGIEDALNHQYFGPSFLAEKLTPFGARPLPPIPASYSSQVHVRSFGQGQLVAFTDFEYFFYR